MLQQQAIDLLFSGQPLATPSICGSNCSYTLLFEGPSLKCHGNDHNITVEDDFGGNFTIFSGKWSYFEEAFEKELSFGELENNDTSSALLHISSLKNPVISSSSNVTLWNLTKSTLICVPFRSLYNVEVSYINNQQTINYTYSELARLTNVDRILYNYAFSGKNDPSWVGENLAWYRDSQLMGITSAVASVLNGVCEDNAIDSVNNTLTNFYDHSVFFTSAELMCTGLGGYLLPYTRFNIGSQIFKISNTLGFTPIVFDITAEALNQLLGNFTLSLITLMGLWNETVNVTRSVSENVYVFSQPLNLILPYSISLLLVLPCLLIGSFALINNGVPAADGSFIQILSTTTGSPNLQRAAASNCLANPECPSEQLRKLKVRYGELADLQVQVGGTVVRRAGFG